MSRIGKHPVPIPSGVEVQLSGQTLTTKGRLGSLSLVVSNEVTASITEGAVTIAPKSDTKQSRAMWGTTRALVSNMVTGVSTGFSRDLEIVGVGYRAIAQGPSKLELQLGFSHPVHFDAPDGVTFEVPAPTRITVRGADKQLVGQVAANIRKIRKPEPYKGKGIRYSDERVLRKAGKSAK